MGSPPWHPSSTACTAVPRVKQHSAPAPWFVLQAAGRGLSCRERWAQASS